MREIKFRGKTKQGQWVKGSYVYAHKWFGNGEAGHFITDIYGGNRILVMPETIGQFTGLYDKNGKEIYEGDVVSLNRDLLGNYIVKYDSKNTRFSMYFDNFEQAGFNLETMKNYEVIGNIYDNHYL